MQSPAHQPALGYQLTHSQQAGWPGSRLAVCLPAEPTLDHYDPEEMVVALAQSHHEVETWAVRHGSLQRPADLRVCAGGVRLADRIGKTVQFFTFGGELRVEPGHLCTRCTLCSPAPIIPLVGADPAYLLLAVEAEALLAMRRAAWGRQQASLDARLACADPVELYAATLEAIRTRLRSYPVGARGDAVLALLALIDTHLRALAEQHSGLSCFDRLEDIL